MLNTWFTSDHHFGHKNILGYEKDTRQFSDIEEMNETLIERWNSAVKPLDTVYHLGDFCFGRANLIIAARLNGKKRLILGNHDVYPSGDYLKYFDKLHGMIFWKRCVLSHMPIHPNGLGLRWFLNLHGHLHSNNVKLPESYMWNNPQYPSDKFNNDLSYFNVSIEQNNLYPFHEDIIYERLKYLDHSLCT